MEGESTESVVQGVSTKVHEIGLKKYIESGSLIEKGCTTDTAVSEEINIVGQPRSGTPIGLVDHRINNKYAVLSIKAPDYVKVHENRESATVAKILSILPMS